MSLVTPLTTLLEGRNKAVVAHTRYAPWLMSAYESPKWSVADSHGGTKVREINFDVRMPDGRSLTEWSSFYQTTKEFAYFVRDGRFSGTEDADRHRDYAQTLMNLCVAISLEGFRSFEFVDQTVIARLLPQIVKGTDALLKASNRLQIWLEVRNKGKRHGYFKGLPLKRAGKGFGKRLDYMALMRHAALPDSARTLSAVARVASKAAKEVGLDGNVDVDEEPAESESESVGAQVDDEQVTHQVMYRYLGTLEMLWSMRDHIQAVSIPEPPFSTPASQVAGTLGRDTVPVPTPPSALAIHLISNSMLWVANYSEPLIQLRAQALNMPGHERKYRHLREPRFCEMVAKMPTGGPPGSPWPLGPRPTRRTGGQISPHEALCLLVIACFNVIAAFSARRKNEVLDLQSSDISGNDTDGWWIKPFIEKTLLAKDWIPVPSIVGKAFEVMKTLSQEARTISNNDRLFDWLNPFWAKPTVMKGTLNPTGALDTFASWVKCPPLCVPDQAPSAWHWTTHQFRKLFAVLYFYRYRGASLEVLAFFLRHFDFEMTRKYLMLDAGNKAVFDEIEWGLRGQIARDIAIKGVDLRGGMAKRLAKDWSESLRRSIRVSAPSIEEASEFIVRQMTNLKLVLTPQPWADCLCPRTAEAAEVANCRRGTDSQHAIGPNYAKAAPSVCIDCPFSIDNGCLESELATEQANAMRIQVTDCEPDSLLNEIMKEKLATLQRYVTK